MLQQQKGKGKKREERKKEEKKEEKKGGDKKEKRWKGESIIIRRGLHSDADLKWAQAAPFSLFFQRYCAFLCVGASDKNNAPNRAN